MLDKVFIDTNIFVYAKIESSEILKNEKAKQSIELSKEKRQALISAAVTGKIDVRGFPPDPRETGSERY